MIYKQFAKEAAFLIQIRRSYSNTTQALTG